MTLPFKVSRKEQHSFSHFTVGKKTWHKCHSLLDVTSVYSEKCFTRSTMHILIQEVCSSQESVVDKERPGRHQNNTAARSFLIDNTFLNISKLITPKWPNVYCSFVKHLSLCTGHNSRWIMAYALAFAYGKRITEYCSLRDTLNGNVAAFNVDKWRHSDVIVIKLTAGNQN